MDVLDIDKNNICKYYKSSNPELDDMHIQAKSLTLLVSMLVLISIPHIDGEHETYITDILLTGKIFKM